MDVLAHYLDIEWESENTPRKVTVSTHSIEIERATDGSLRAEVSIFRDFAPWLGIHLSGTLADLEPVTIGAQDERTPWLKIPDDEGREWWIPATGWSRNARRYLAEMHRSFGTFQVEIGAQNRLMVDAIALELDRAHAQDYLDDFRDELVWLAVGQPNGALAEAGSDYSHALVEALDEFAQAARRVLDHPAREVREQTALVAPAKLRPNADTFRAAMRRPGAKAYPSRVAVENADVPENRFVRGMVEHCCRLAQSVAHASDRHQGHLAVRAEREKARAAALNAMEVIEIDPEIYDNQIEDISRIMNAIAAWDVDSIDPDRHPSKFHFTVGGVFKTDLCELFYRNPNRSCEDDLRDGINFSVVRLPDTLYDLVLAGHRIDSKLSITLVGNASIKKFRYFSKVGKRAHFSSISQVEVHSPVLEDRLKRRPMYERNGWRRRLSHVERKEFALEARTAQTRATQLEQRARLSEAVHDRLYTVEGDLARQTEGWKKLGVSSTTTFPMSVRFAQNPTYAAALASFHKVTELAKHTGIGGDALDRLGSINMLHASAIYERWCLIKIINVLMEDFDFIPKGNWVEQVIGSACRRSTEAGQALSIKFSRSSPGIMARLEVEPHLDNGRRPDFRLRFKMVPPADSSKSIFGNAAPSGSGLVMDAKFRTRWHHDELAEMLTLLVETKKYGQDGCRVFILQPAKAAMVHTTSPLGWGRDCDYGHGSPTNHAHGSVQLSADLADGTGSIMNLRRLIAMELQDVFPEPEAKTVSGPTGDRDVCASTSSFCVSCGSTHDLDDVKPGKTSRDNRKWYFSCANCGAGIMRTHCFGCATTLHKNGLQMTYHLTVADQISNVVCQACGSYFLVDSPIS